ncbi:MAG: hypothetical protein GX794_02780, partial [Acholeplasmataceae bacterium]|nr:hypothetical protein [Acholeplasmataceae bacterium]
MKRILTLLSILFLSILLVGCSFNFDFGSKSIRFVTNKGTPIETIKFKGTYETSQIDLLTTTKEGYEFLGWYLTSDFSGSDQLAEVIDKSITLYAKWEAIKYSIHYSIDGGVNHQSNPEYFTIEDKITLKDPSKAGFKFIGWYLDINFEEETTEIVKGTKNEVFLYAFFEPDVTDQFTITYKIDGEVYGEVETYQVGEAIDFRTNYEIEGYTFSGWDLTDIPSVMPANNLIINGYLTINEYEISFYNEDGQTKLETIFVNYGEMPIPTVNPTKTATIEYSYQFVGWEPDLEPASQNTIYTALFLKVGIEYTVTWTVEGVELKEYYRYGEAIDSIPTPIKEGHTFNGWLDIPETMPANNIVITGTFSPSVFEIVFYDEDGITVLDTLMVEYYQLPNPTVTPTKAQDLEYSYTFKGWVPEIVVATEDTSYQASYEATSIGQKAELDPTNLNLIFGFDIYKLIPNIYSNDYQLDDSSTIDFKEVYIDIFDWTEADKDNYMALLENLYLYDEIEMAFVLENYYVGVYKETEYYPGEIVFGIILYSKDDQNGTTNFNPSELNAIFGFDIYSLMPKIMTNDYQLFDESTSTYQEVYIDIFDWTEAMADNYIDLLEALLNYDYDEGAWILGDYYIYVYEDDVNYLEMVYGIAIEGEIKNNGFEDNLYYSFNLQNTTTSLDGSYKNNIDVVLDFNNNSSKVVVKASHLADISAQAPSGLSQGIIFAADVSGLTNPLVYLEIDTLGTIISSFSFEIEARNSYENTLKGAKIQVYDGSDWVDLVDGNFYNELSTDQELIVIENLNSSKFRILLIGSGQPKNGGQVMISEIKLYSKPVVIESWLELVADLETVFDDSNFDYLPELNELKELVLTKIHYYEYKISGSLLTANNETYINNYYLELLQLGYVIDEDLSIKRAQNVYSYYIDDDLAYALYILFDNETAEIVIFKYDPVIESKDLITLDKQQSINEYELATFGKSGLPSTGSYEVLVIPVEIKDKPFAADYDNKLDLVFNGTQFETGWESVASFYYRSSYGLLDLTFEIAPKYISLYNSSYYESFGDEGDQAVIKEALLGLDEEIDFSRYDYNNDGYIDSVIFIYSYDYDYDTDPWWAWVYSAKFGEASQIDNLDGKKFEYYFWASYAFLEDPISGNDNIIVNAETYIHEMGHLFGIVDFYQHEDTYDYGPLGGFDMMDHNVGDHGPFNKLVFGWLQPLLAVNGS